MSTMKYIDEIDVQIDSWYICVSGVLFASIFIIPNIHFTTYAIYDVVILIRFDDNLQSYLTDRWDNLSIILCRIFFLEFGKLFFSPCIFQQNLENCLSDAVFIYFTTHRVGRFFFVQTIFHNSFPDMHKLFILLVFLSCFLTVEVMCNFQFIGI